MSQDYSSMVNFARCKVAGADVTRCHNQKTINGIEYDYMMWIDSDIAFDLASFTKLFTMDCDVASGWYQQPGGTTPVVEKMDDEYFEQNPNNTEWDFVNDSYKHYYLQGKWELAEWRMDRRPDWFPTNWYAKQYNKGVRAYNAKQPRYPLILMEE